MSLNLHILATAQTSYHHGRCILEIGRHCLKIPGRLLDLSTLLDKKKFRAYDNKEGALRGFRALEEDGLGSLEKRGRGTNKVRTKNTYNWANSNMYLYYNYSLTNFANDSCRLMMMRMKNWN